MTNRAGFALPLAIFVIGMLTAAVAAGFAATSSEAVVNNAQRAQERAYQIAEAGLQQFMVRRSETGFCTGCVSDPTASVDSEYTRVQLTGGYADVVSKRIWNPTTGSQSPVFFIRSKGVDTAARMSVGGGTIFAERTVGLYARWSNTTINVQGAMTSLNPIYRAVNGGAVSGTNSHCSGSTLPSVTASVMPVGGRTGNWSGVGYDDTKSYATLAANQAINWDQVIAGTVTADVTIPPGSWPGAGGYTNWPIVRVKNNASAVLPIVAGAQGLIIADSNFRIPPTADWNGVILIGGRLTMVSGSGSNTRIRGAVVTGLNRTKSVPGGSPGTDSLLENSLQLDYYPCYVTDAGHKLRGYTPMPNTWMDNVASW